MRDRTDAETPAELERLRGRLDGGAIPHPPVLPVVAVVCLLFGLSFGLALAPKDGAGGPNGPSTAAASSVPTTSGPPSSAPTVPPSVASEEAACLLELGCHVVSLHGATIQVTEPAPAGGVTLAAAIESARRANSFDDKDILSVTLMVDIGFGWAAGESASPGGSARWVWQIVLRNPTSWTCTGELSSPQPLESPPTTSYSFCQIGDSPLLEMREIIIVDYLTGQPLVTIVSPYPMSNP